LRPRPAWVHKAKDEGRNVANGHKTVLKAKAKAWVNKTKDKGKNKANGHKLSIRLREAIAGLLKAKDWCTRTWPVAIKLSLRPIPRPWSGFLRPKSRAGTRPMAIKLSLSPRPSPWPQFLRPRTGASRARMSPMVKTWPWSGFFRPKTRERMWPMAIKLSLRTLRPGTNIRGVQN